MNQTVTQSLENLPDEILSLPRFFKVRADKRPLTKGWSNPDNQKLYSEINGHKGFDTAGHDKGDDFLFLDFDHVLTDNGEFVTAKAEQLFNRIHARLKSYCELSASKRGIHIIAKPTAGKFKKISSGKNGRIYFNEDKTVFLELFYGTGGRYCYFTGDVYQCAPQAPVTHGEQADGVFQELLDIIADQNKKAPKSTTCAAAQSKTTQQQGEEKISQLMATDDRDRALNMLAVIPVADLSREDWLNVGMALKNNGNSVSDWEQWSRNDDRFKQGECETLWQGFSYGGGLTIATIHDLAKKYGYQEPSQHSAPMNDDKKVRTRDRIKDCPVNLVLPENFIWTKQGITQLVPSKKDTEEFKYLPVTKTPIVITKKFREPSKGTVEFEIALRLRNQWQYVVVDGKTLADARQLTELGNYDAIINATDRLKQFFDALRACNPDLPQVKTYKQTGWTDPDCTTFAYPTGNNDYIVRRAGFDYEEIFKPKGDLDAWKKKFVEVSEQGGAIARITIGAIAASCLVKPLGLPNLQLHIDGKSGIGKSALPEFGASIYGDPSAGALTRTFSATMKNRLELATAFCDLPQILDELETLSKRDEENLSSSIYEYSLGICNQAQKRDGTARETKRFSGARISTGERPILKQNDKHGAYKRVLCLHVKTLFDDDFAFELHNFSKHNRGLFGYQWIQYVTKNIDLIAKHFENVCATIKRLVKDINATQLKSLAVAAVAYQHFKICIGLKDLASGADAMNAEIGTDLDTIIATLPRDAELNDTARAIEGLSSYIAGHTKSFNRPVKDSTTGRIEEVSAWGTVCQGRIFDNGEVAILPTELRKILEDELKFASADKLINEWKEQGDILITDAGRTTHKVTIGDDRPRTIHFKARILVTCPDDEELIYYEEMGVI